MGHSTVWRCDRCGATSPASAGSEQPEGWAECALLVADGGHHPDDTFAADLCPTCVAALRQWLTSVD